MNSGRQGLRLLVVEDMFLIADSLSAFLREHGCDVVEPVAHLEQGLDLARDAALDGAILDINLDGELCFPIADTVSARRIPYVFVTGYTEDFLPAKYRRIPRLVKPFEEAELEQMLLSEFSRAA
jgi:DNA-binding response OmpR family regulator